MKKYKVGSAELTLKPFGINSINRAVKFFNELDNAKSQFCEGIDMDLIQKYEDKMVLQQTAYIQVKNKIDNLTDKKEISEEKKYLKRIEAEILKIEREIDSDAKVKAEFKKKADKENLGAMEFYTRDNNLRNIIEMTCEGDIDKIDFDDIDGFYNLLKVAGEIQADFFTRFAQTTSN